MAVYETHGRTPDLRRQIINKQRRTKDPLTVKELEELCLRTGVSVPAAYVDHLESMARRELLENGFDPKTLLVLNLELAQELDQAGASQSRLYLSGDGCGNYYFVDLKADADTVKLWAHDPLGIEDPEASLQEHLRAGNELSRIDSPVFPGNMYICRTERYGESILDPIELQEWIDAVEATPGVTYRGYRDATNPFTGEKDSFEIPGYCVVATDKKTLSLQLHCGRGAMTDEPELLRIANALAKRLNAKVLAHTSKSQGG